MEQGQTPNFPFRFELHVEQVVDGSHYKGYLKRNGKEVRYVIHFTIPIPELDNVPQSELSTPEAVRRTFPIELQKADGTNIPLGEDLYGFFFQTIAMYAVDFYNTPQTRASNDSPTLSYVVGRFGGKVSLGMTTTKSFNVPPDLNEKLEACFA